MNRSDLVDLITGHQAHLRREDVSLAVRSLIDQMATALASGDRIEIRGFGVLSIQYRGPRMGRNPKTGESLVLAGKYVPHFKPGKGLRQQVNPEVDAAAEVIIEADSADGGMPLRQARLS